MTGLQKRISSDSSEDKIYLGQLVEKATQGEFGDLLRIIINGITAEELAKSSIDAKMPADRYLGRIEGLNILQDKLILMIDIKNSLVEELRKSRRVGAESD